MIRNKFLMLPIIILLSFAWLAIEASTWLMALMARGALSVAQQHIWLHQIDARLVDAKKPLDGAFRQISSFMRTPNRSNSK
jgi:hypothetical protein